MTKGWYGQSQRHSMSAKGIRTKNNISNYSNNEYFGTDIDLETALEEYGFVMKETDKPNEYFVIYKMYYPDGEHYGSGFINEEEMDAIVQGKEWLDEKEIQSMLETFGITSKEEWYNLPVQYKFSDLFGYWGHENIMGTDYYPNNKEWAYEKIGIESSNGIIRPDGKEYSYTGVRLYKFDELSPDAQMKAFMNSKTRNQSSRFDEYGTEEY